MKAINALTVSICMSLAALPVKAQEYKTSVGNTKEGRLVLKDFEGRLPVEGYAGNEIIITSENEKFATAPDRAKGLKPVYSGGTDNTGLGLSVEKNGNEVVVQC